MAKTKALVPIGYYILVIAFLYSLVCIGPGWKKNCWFLLKIFTFYNLEKIYILHGHVFDMVIISHTFVFVFNMKVEMIGLFQTYKHVAF